MSNGWIPKSAVKVNDISDNWMPSSAKKVEEVASEKSNPMDSLKTALGIVGTGAGVYGAAKGTKAITKKVSEYPYTKTLAIREGLKKSQKAESTIYGQGLKTISKQSTEMVNPAGSIEKMELFLREKGILDAAGNKIGMPSDAIEAQYLKSYNNLMDKFSKSQTGKVKIGEVIQESRNIKAKGGKFGTSKSANASRLSNDLIEGISPEIKSPEFKAMKQRYGTHREEMKPLEEIFKPYENIYKTAKGEKVLTDIYGQSVGTRKALANLPRKAGQTIKGAKVLSRAQQVNPLNIMRGKRFLGALGVAPMVMDAYSYSKDPQGYVYEQETGKPREELKRLQALAGKKELTDKEISDLVKARLIA